MKLVEVCPCQVSSSCPGQSLGVFETPATKKSLWLEIELCDSAAWAPLCIVSSLSFAIICPERHAKWRLCPLLHFCIKFFFCLNSINKLGIYSVPPTRGKKWEAFSPVASVLWTGREDFIFCFAALLSPQKGFTGSAGGESTFTSSLTSHRAAGFLLFFHGNDVISDTRTVCLSVCQSADKQATVCQGAAATAHEGETEWIAQEFRTDRGRERESWMVRERVEAILLHFLPCVSQKETGHRWSSCVFRDLAWWRCYRCFQVMICKRQNAQVHVFF